MPSAASLPTTAEPPRLALGCAQLGNLLEAIDDRQARSVLEAAWSAGVRAFDTAPHYGLGLSERRLGDFLRSLAPAELQQVEVSTKVGRLLERDPGYSRGAMDTEGFAVPAKLRRVWDVSRDGIRRCLDESLTRLGLDRVATVYLHDPDRYPSSGASVARGLDVLAHLRTERLVTRVGVGSMSTAALEHAVRHPVTDVLMVAGRYTLLDRSAERSLLPRCQERGVEVSAAAVFGSGVLATPTPGGTYEYVPASAETLAYASRLARICEQHGTDLPTAALHFGAQHPAVSQVVVGARTPVQVEENHRRWRTPPGATLWSDLATAWQRREGGPHAD